MIFLINDDGNLDHGETVTGMHNSLLPTVFDILQRYFTE